MTNNHWNLTVETQHKKLNVTYVAEVAITISCVSIKIKYGYLKVALERYEVRILIFYP